MTIFVLFSPLSKWRSMLLLLTSVTNIFVKFIVVLRSNEEIFTNLVIIDILSDNELLFLQWYLDEVLFSEFISFNTLSKTVFEIISSKLLD